MVQLVRFRLTTSQSSAIDNLQPETTAFAQRNRTAHPASRPGARVRVAPVPDRGKPRVSVVGVAALVGAERSDAKARASRANGRLGGRPPKRPTKRTPRTKTSR